MKIGKKNIYSRELPIIYLQLNIINKTQTYKYTKDKQTDEKLQVFLGGNICLLFTWVYSQYLYYSEN